MGGAAAAGAALDLRRVGRAFSQPKYGHRERRLKTDQWSVAAFVKYSLGKPDNVTSTARRDAFEPGAYVLELRQLQQ